MQTVATVVLWGGTLAPLAYTVHLGRRERSILPVVLVLSVAVGSIIEPLYDIELRQHRPGGDVARSPRKRREPATKVRREHRRWVSRRRRRRGG